MEMGQTSREKRDLDHFQKVIDAGEGALGSVVTVTSGQPDHTGSSLTPTTVKLEIVFAITGSEEQRRAQIDAVLSLEWAKLREGHETRR